jgi:hypothetical protein
MKYIKKLALYTKSPMDDRLSVYPDGRIVTNSLTSLEVPTGSTAQRPTTLVDGTIRYNTSLKEFEVYNSQNPGPTPWEIVRTIRPATITCQNLGYGNYNDYIFGPLAYPVSITKPQNVLVFIGPAFQVPVTNYTLVTNPNATTTTLSYSVSPSVNTLYVSTLTNIDAGEPGQWRAVSAASGIQVGTTVTNISINYSSTFSGWAVGLSLPTTGPLTTGTTISVGYSAGTYVQFTSPVPNASVTSLLGFDGYFPAGPLGTAFES